ncbi:MAG TPA: VCBS repeat-containing protein, partial [Minicystis sp.]|nr:VCBS repeat-containing protein [Minicystis sp.]
AGGGGTGGSVTTFAGPGPSSSGSGGSIQCGTPCDPQTEICSHGVCVPKATCTTDDDCENDTYCKDGNCAPWSGKMPPDDPSCINVIAAGVFAPKVKCEFSAAPPGDPFPNHVDVQSTPVVVNFHKPADSGPPSILASFTATVVNSYTEELGVIRILRGDDCTLEANLGGTDLDNDGTVDWTVSSATLAVGDLDGDGIADIVAYGADGSTLAFTKHTGTWALLWKAPYPAGAPWAPCNTTNHRCSLGWAGPSIHDLDDDGVPEVIREGVVFDGATGALKSLQPPNYSSYNSGNFSVLANLDQDPAIELTNGQHIWEFSNGAWTEDPTFSTPAPGFVAVADFGAYGSGPATTPEIVVVTGNTVAIYATDGTAVMPPVTVPPVPGKGPGGGGPPTIADFDGDGLPEVAVAGRGFYTIYDIDCGPNPRPGGVCPSAGAMGAQCDFVPGACPAQGYYAWSRQSQDYSSNVTGSSVFDFEADGTSEVVYADECFVRVYNGKTGEVEFSQYHSSCTWYENPVVADTDGNFRADLVTPSNKACSADGTGIVCQTLDANGVDALFAGIHCKKNADCVSNVCDSGLCRCTAGAECCGAMDDAMCLEEGFACVPPPPGTPGTGNTCRAAHPHGLSGIRVYSDANDKWVRSRTIWNQHAYAVTNVNDDGTIPKTSMWKDNWLDPALNNFRQNVPGTPNGKATGDATAGASDTFGCGPAGAVLQAPVCNRGADPIASGLSVGFYVDGMLVCSSTTMQVLHPGECETVSCTWAGAPQTKADAVDVTVVPNDQHMYAECKKDNNDGIVKDVFCKPPA